MFWFGAAPETRPFGCTAGLLFCQVVFGPSTVAPSVPSTTGYAGVASDASSTRVQLRLPLPPWPACTNQSRPQGVSCLSVAFFTSFCIEIVPSEQVVWLWKSPATYLPPTTLAGSGFPGPELELSCAEALIAAAPSVAAMASASLFIVPVCICETPVPSSSVCVPGAAPAPLGSGTLLGRRDVIVTGTHPVSRHARIHRDVTRLSHR